MLTAAKVPVPRHAIVWRDKEHPPSKFLSIIFCRKKISPQPSSSCDSFFLAAVVERDDEIEIEGHLFKKPFVEKPVSAEDHNIIIYYPTSAGGGSRRLFRKVSVRLFLS